MQKQYLCIDLKSFYASVECVERGLDPMTTNLVVADPERGDKTICLAVSPSLKKLGVGGRCRVFEIPKGVDYIMAEPRMQKYIDYSAEIYGIYLRYISKDDIHVYSVDEAFLDVTPYLKTYGMTAKEMALMLMQKITEEVGVRATCGIGTNLYLTKIALDIMAKHAPDYIGILDEETYREKLWDHKPLTDFWRIGRGTARSLQAMGIDTMRKLAHADENLLYKKYGVDAELMIDHAWGREPVTIADIKAYKPKSTSTTSGQVLMRDYNINEGRLVLREMVDQACLDLVRKKMLTTSISIMVGFSNASDEEPVRGTAAVPIATNSSSMLIPAVMQVYDRIVDPSNLVRRFFVTCNNLVADEGPRQLSFFDTVESEDGVQTEIGGFTSGNIEKDRKAQQAILDIKEKFGKNAMFKAMDLEEAATTLERNNQIGGHKSGTAKKER